MFQKKREPKLFYKSSQNFCPIRVKICMHNLNTYSFQNIIYEILNSKTFLDIWRCFWFSKMKNEQKHSFFVYFGFILVRHLIGRVDKLGEYGCTLQTFCLILFYIKFFYVLSSIRLVKYLKFSADFTKLSPYTQLWASLKISISC